MTSRASWLQLQTTQPHPPSLSRTWTAILITAAVIVSALANVMTLRDNEILLVRL